MEQLVRCHLTISLFAPELRGPFCSHTNIQILHKQIIESHFLIINHKLYSQYCQYCITAILLQPYYSHSTTSISMTYSVIYHADKVYGYTYITCLFRAISSTQNSMYLLKLETRLFKSQPYYLLVNKTRNLGTPAFPQSGNSLSL